MKLYQEDMCKLHINYLKCSAAERTHSSVYTQTTLLQVKGAIQEKASSEGSGTPRHRLLCPQHRVVQVSHHHHQCTCKAPENQKPQVY